MLNKIKKAIAGLASLVAILAAPNLAQAQAMRTTGLTSQPIGHYDFCKRYPDTCRTDPVVGTAQLTKPVWAKLISVNNAVNTSIFPRTDQEIYGKAEYWNYPETQGDCEDFVLLKQYMLERAGLPASALLITVVRQPNGEGHAVLTVRTDRGDYILDNLDDRVLLWTDTDYQYLKRQSDSDAGKWVGISDDRNILVGSVR